MLNQNNNKKAITKKPHIAEGKWTRAEHDRFLRGMELYGRNWSMVQKKVKTRTITQIRSHAQKVFQNMSKEDIDALIGCTKDEEGF
jgi:SHAQKYF class myb-like DNA-binding protein